LGKLEIGNGMRVEYVKPRQFVGFFNVNNERFVNIVSILGELGLLIFVRFFR
jgi:hypothetical protein